MNKKSLYLSATYFIISLLLFNACKPNDPELNDSWNKEAEEYHDQVLELQDEIGNDFENWLITMDSIDAVEKAYQSFISNEFVESATINSQGISVQYDNGMKGGLFLWAKDDKTQETGVMQSIDNYTIKSPGLKSLVNKRKMILINPHYYERSFYTDQIYTINSSNISRAGFELSTFYKNSEATVDRFANLTGYGIIQIYSHGWAWPKEKSITDVYLLTGETANTTTSKKYWGELKTGNIPVMKIAGANKYLISPAFIKKHNDFSKDTVLFFGGFCYSFLGDWPDIIESFADGAYIGFDWSVYTFRNANWSVNSMAMLSDTSKNVPLTLEKWMQNGEMEKSYWNPDDKRNVEIHYTGDGTLTLWDKINVKLINLSSDGAPVSKPGVVGTAYSFRCDVVTNISPLEYVWDIGDGSSPATTQGKQVNITWSKDGNFTLTVSVKNKNNGTIIGKTSLEITIGETIVEPTEDIIKFAKTCNTASCIFTTGGAIQYSPYSDWGGSTTWSSNITWSGLSFSGSVITTGRDTYSIEGTLSSDGKKVSFTAHNEIIDYVEVWSSYTISVSNLPLTYFDSKGSYNNSPSLDYISEKMEIKNYITNFKGYFIEENTTKQTHTVIGIDWEEIEHLGFYLIKKN